MAGKLKSIELAKLKTGIHSDGGGAYPCTLAMPSVFNVCVRGIYSPIGWFIAERGRLPIVESEKVRVILYGDGRKSPENREQA